MGVVRCDFKIQLSGLARYRESLCKCCFLYKPCDRRVTRPARQKNHGHRPVCARFNRDLYLEQPPVSFNRAVIDLGVARISFATVAPFSRARDVGVQYSRAIRHFVNCVKLGPRRGWQNLLPRLCLIFISLNPSASDTDYRKIHRLGENSLFTKWCPGFVSAQNGVLTLERAVESFDLSIDLPSFDNFSPKRLCSLNNCD